MPDIPMTLEGFIAGPNEDVGRRNDWRSNGNSQSNCKE